MSFRLISKDSAGLSAHARRAWGPSTPYAQKELPHGALKHLYRLPTRQRPQRVRKGCQLQARKLTLGGGHLRQSMPVKARGLLAFRANHRRIGRAVAGNHAFFSCAVECAPPPWSIPCSLGSLISSARGAVLLLHSQRVNGQGGGWRWDSGAYRRLTCRVDFGAECFLPFYQAAI